MKQLIVVITILIGLISCKTPPKHADIEAGWKNMEVILKRINAPVFPDRIFNIMDFGATADGTIYIEAFLKAILECNK